MKCNNCGHENPEGTTFCINCGSKLAAAQGQPNPAQQPYATPQQPYATPQYNAPVYVAQPFNSNNIPPEYQPISMWGYFGYEILFSIPCVGLILLIVFSLGGTKNVNLRNFARSYFCFLIIAAILVVIFVVFAGGAGALLAIQS